MKLNDDCITDVLFTLEESLELTDDLFAPIPLTLKDICTKNDTMGKYSPKEVFYTLKKLAEAGYILTEDSRNDESKSYRTYSVLDITFQGHEYIRKLRTQSSD